MAKKDATNLAKKVAAVSDSTKSLSKEIKSMTKVFSDNQKVLLSMKGMIDTLIDTLEQIQKQSKQINIIEEDNQRLYAGLNQVRAQASMITNVGDQANRLQEQVNKIIQTQKEAPNPNDIINAVSESQNSIQNNTHMIIKIAQRIDSIKDDLAGISAKADKTSNIESELDKIKEKIHTVLENSQNSSLESDFGELKNSLAKIQDDLTTTVSKTDAVTHIRGEIEKIQSEVSSLIHRADSTAFVGEGLKSVQSDLTSFKDHIFDKTNTIDQKISSISDLLKRADAASLEFHKKADSLAHDVQHIKSVTNKASSDASKEIVALLKLSEFQSGIRITSESKYGDLKDIQRMAEQTSEIVNLFDKVSIESQQKVSLPQEIRQWAISKMLDCADKWEIRFSDLYSVLIGKLGKELVKENIRIAQVRDIFGIRGVDEIRKELGLHESA
ncbi:MAG: chemotaxis protein [Nitrosopumilaceae archaeon]|nr:chemotaxis protein [Nitrosopumilaceae archaeon]